MRKLRNEELGRKTVAEFKGSKKLPVVLVLDNIRSMHNVGSAFRTADSFLMEKILLTGITAQPPHREINKAALGATETVVWAHYEKVEECLSDLAGQGYEIWAVEQVENAVSLPDFKPVKERKYAFVFGNEVFGVSEEAISKCTGTIEIPQFGTKHSLNVSVSMGVVLWDYVLKTLY